MKALVCEMCGSHELLKQDGMYVCQSCGTKYTTEEAKKLMVEGTVKLDESGKIENFLTLAENAHSSGNNKEAEEYCNRIIEIEPANAEAWLLKGIAAAWQSTLANDRTQEFTAAASNAFSLAGSVDELEDLVKRAYREHYQLSIALNKLRVDHVVSFPDTFSDYIKTYSSSLGRNLELSIAYSEKLISFNEELPDEEPKREKSFSEMTGLDDLREQCDSYLITGGIKLWNNEYNHYLSENNGYPSEYTFDRIYKNGWTAICMVNMPIGEAVPSKIASKINDKNKANIMRACQNLITMLTKYCELRAYKADFSGGAKWYVVSKHLTLERKKELTAKVRNHHEIIKLCDPDYEVPEVPEPKPTKTGGCYVATAVYGSYDCPQVWTLRRYRDHTLAKTWYGRAFIRAYYAVSPTLVNLFGDAAWFKGLWKPRLDSMVERLNQIGVESTPYNDREW